MINFFSFLYSCNQHLLSTGKIIEIKTGQEYKLIFYEKQQWVSGEGWTCHKLSGDQYSLL